MSGTQNIQVDEKGHREKKVCCLRTQHSDSQRQLKPGLLDDCSLPSTILPA